MGKSGTCLMGTDNKYPLYMLAKSDFCSYFCYRWSCFHPIITIIRLLSFKFQLSAICYAIILFHYTDEKLSYCFQCFTIYSSSGLISEIENDWILNNPLSFSITFILEVFCLCGPFDCQRSTIPVLATIFSEVIFGSYSLK